MNVPRLEGSPMGQLSPRGEARKCPPLPKVPSPVGDPGGQRSPRGKTPVTIPSPASEGTQPDAAGDFEESAVSE